MPLPNWESWYPTLNEFFGAHEQILGPSHPLGYLVSIDDDNVRTAAVKTEAAARIVKAENPQWLKSKCSTVIDSSLVNASAMLSEIRAHGDLLCAWRAERIRTNPDGPDFVVELGRERVFIEVHTPQGRSDSGRVSRRIEETIQGNVRMSISEFAPFGLPQGSVPTTQAECASSISQIKEHKEHQFPGSGISILWLDFNDPGIWQIPMDGEQALPVMTGRESLTSGCFWSAFYGEQADAVFDSLNVEGMSPKPYRMEFPGRFSRDSRIDFVIIDTLHDKIVFQNHKGIKPVPDQLFRDFFRLPRFSLKLSWLDWPIRSSLLQRVAHARQEIEIFTSAFTIL